MIDVHVAHMPGERQDWWKECEQSLRGHPITLHHIDGIRGDIRQTRYDGYRRGTHEYVAYVDPDDRVLPGVFMAMLDVLQGAPNYAGAYCLSHRMDESGNILGLTHSFREYDRKYLSYNIAEIHQIAVVKRDIIMSTMENNWDIIPRMSYAEIVYHALVSCNYDWKAVNFVGYEWRDHIHGAHLHCNHKRHEIKKTLHEIYENIVNVKQQ